MWRLKSEPQQRRGPMVAFRRTPGIQSFEESVLMGSSGSLRREERKRAVGVGVS
ncbi:hypothetical protein TorRG33x02_357620 [Trema orientale]|uniref:Uncharacterized protein n=1 Tax=Trema orientale TaxID=63057 RepID=A0A2P5A4P4_TREOI|nr:hypothetical protein TorRG33x02_357620 [Trema orientale]